MGLAELRPLLVPPWPHLAVIDGTELTHWRTACVSALASTLLSRSAAETLLMIGAGFLAPHLIKAHLTARPGSKKIIVWNRTSEKALELVDKFDNKSEGFGEVVFERNECLEDVVGLADIVSCATNSNVSFVREGGAFGLGRVVHSWDGRV